MHKGVQLMRHYSHLARDAQNLPEQCVTLANNCIFYVSGRRASCSKGESAFAESASSSKARSSSAYLRRKRGQHFPWCSCCN